MAPQRAFSAPTVTNTIQRVPSRWDGRNVRFGIGSQRMSVYKSRENQVLTSTGSHFPRLSSMGTWHSTGSSVLVKPGLSVCSSPAQSPTVLVITSTPSPQVSIAINSLLHAPTAAAAVSQHHQDGHHAVSSLLHAPTAAFDVTQHHQNAEPTVLLPEFEPPEFPSPLPVPDSPDVNTPLQAKPKQFGEWPCVTSPQLKEDETKLRNWFSARSSCSTAAESKGSARADVSSPSPESGLESAMPSCLSTCMSYHSSKVVDANPNASLLSPELLLQTSSTLVIPGLGDDTFEAQDELDVQSDEPSSEAGYHTHVSRVRYHGPAANLSPWTPAWSFLDTATTTPVVTGSHDADVEDRHFQWCAPIVEVLEKPSCGKDLPPLDFENLQGNLESSGQKYSTRSCSSTCSYSSSDNSDSEADNDAPEHRFT